MSLCSTATHLGLQGWVGTVESNKSFLSLPIHMPASAVHSLRIKRDTQIADNNYQTVGTLYPCAKFKSKAERWQLL